jgi:tetratricopeptide (TPR) repeat protein
VVVAIAVVGVREARAQTESAEALRAIELENAGKFREAIPIYRQAMRTQPTPIVVLGLERAYAELGMSDSLIAPLDTLLAKFPREPLYHVIHLRTFQILRR